MNPASPLPDTIHSTDDRPDLPGQYIVIPSAYDVEAVTYVDTKTDYAVTTLDDVDAVIHYLTVMQCAVCHTTRRDIEAEGRS